MSEKVICGKVFPGKFSQAVYTCYRLRPCPIPGHEPAQAEPERCKQRTFANEFASVTSPCGKPLDKNGKCADHPPTFRCVGSCHRTLAHWPHEVAEAVWCMGEAAPLPAQEAALSAVPTVPTWKQMEEAFEDSMTRSIFESDEVARRKKAWSAVLALFGEARASGETRA